jgi:hypothetical protein
MGVSPSRLQQSNSNATRLECDESGGGYRDGKNTRSYSDNYPTDLPRPAPRLVRPIQRGVTAMENWNGENGSKQALEGQAPERAKQAMGR